MSEDIVNHPRHYELPNGLECYDVICATQGDVLTAGFCEGTVKKYMFRAHMKGKTLEDHKKARWYLDNLIAIEERLENDGVDLEALWKTLDEIEDDRVD